MYGITCRRSSNIVSIDKYDNTGNEVDDTNITRRGLKGQCCVVVIWEYEDLAYNITLYTMGIQYFVSLRCQIKKYNTDIRI